MLRMQHIKNHLEILRKGGAIKYYGDAWARHRIKLRIRLTKDDQLAFPLYRDMKAILRATDHLTLCAYMHGLNRALVSTLEHCLKEGMVVVDLGAHKGLYTLVCASLVGPAGKVYAFEPVPTLFDRLQENVQLNSLSNVATFRHAAGSLNSRSKLFLSKRGGDEWASLYEWQQTGRKCVNVSVVSLDRWLDKQKVDHIDLLKIDVEGSELDVIAGAGKALASGKVQSVIVEFNPDTQKAAGFQAQDLRDSLEEHGYRWYGLPYNAIEKKEADWSSLRSLCDLIAIR